MQQAHSDALQQAAVLQQGLTAQESLTEQMQQTQQSLTLTVDSVDDEPPHDSCCGIVEFYLSTLWCIS